MGAKRAHREPHLFARQPDQVGGRSTGRGVVGGLKPVVAQSCERKHFELIHMEMVGTWETRTSVLNSSTWPFPKNKAWKMEQETKDDRNNSQFQRLALPPRAPQHPETLHERLGWSDLQTRGHGHGHGHLHEKWNCVQSGSA